MPSLARVARVLPCVRSMACANDVPVLEASTKSWRSLVVASEVPSPMAVITATVAVSCWNSMPSVAAMGVTAERDLASWSTSVLPRFWVMSRMSETC